MSKENEIEQVESNIGRPKVKIDRIAFDALMDIPFATVHAIAGVFKCSEKTIQRYVNSEYGLTFDQLKAEKSENIKLKLGGKQYEVAMKGNVPMLVWLGKQYLGQSDKQEIKSDQKHSFENVTDNDLDSAINEKIKKLQISDV
jgi:AraC-like DNA-binding protein